MKRRLIAGLFTAAGIIGACVIAEPPADLPTAPSARPIILRDSTFPPSTGIFTGWPSFFIVPVQLSDPRVSFIATCFVDYNPANGDGFVLKVESTPGLDGTNIRKLELPIDKPTAEGCHVVEVVVAKELDGLTNGRSLHTPRTPATDGDSVSWIYSSTGDPSGCPVTDAGLTPIDAGADAGDGGDGGSN